MRHAGEGISRLKGFWSFNAFYVTTALSILGLDAQLRAIVSRHVVWAVLAGGVIECAILAAVLWLNRRPESVIDPVPRSDPDSEKTQARLAVPADFDAVSNIFSQWFPASVAGDDAEYIKTMASSHVRVIESRYRNGTTKVTGYYSLWPINKTFYNSMVEGAVEERDFKASMIFALESHDAEVLYIPEICILRGSRAGRALIGDVLREVTKYLSSHPEVELIAAWPATPAGLDLVRRCGMTVRRRIDGAASNFYEVSRSDALALHSEEHAT